MVSLFYPYCREFFRMRMREVKRGCSFDHNLVEMGRSRWADLKPGMADEGQTEQELLEFLQVKYGVLGVSEAKSKSSQPQEELEVFFRCVPQVSSLCASFRTLLRGDIA